MSTESKSSKKKTNASKRIVEMFIDQYEYTHGSKYLVNWPMVRAAERVGEHYAVSEVGRALEYYFRTRTKHDLWSFIEKIDECLRASENEDAAKKRVEELLEKTRRKMGEFKIDES
jgi:hypothetical protein